MPQAGSPYIPRTSILHSYTQWHRALQREASGIPLAAIPHGADHQGRIGDKTRGAGHPSMPQPMSYSPRLHGQIQACAAEVAGHGLVPFHALDAFARTTNTTTYSWFCHCPYYLNWATCSYQCGGLNSAASMTRCALTHPADALGFVLGCSPALDYAGLQGYVLVQLRVQGHWCTWWAADGGPPSLSISSSGTETWVHPCRPPPSLFL